MGVTIALFHLSFQKPVQIEKFDKKRRKSRCPSEVDVYVLNGVMMLL